MNKRGKWTLWMSVVLVVILVIILFLYFALAGPNYSKKYDKMEKEGEIVNPLNGISAENVENNFDESFVFYILYEIKAYNLHNPPLSGNIPKIEFFVGDETYNAEIKKGEIDVNIGEIEGEDLVILTTKEEAIKMIKNKNYVKESFKLGKTTLELKADKTTLFAKGYLSLYKDLTGESISGNVIRIYTD